MAGLLLWLTAAKADEVAEPTAEVEARAADTLYLLALDAWRVRDAESALNLAVQAQASGVRHEPAALLEAYARLRLQQRQEAIVVLRGLAIGADRAQHPEVKAAATKLYYRHTDLNNRSHPSVLVGLQNAARYTGADWSGGAGYTLGLDFPLTELLGISTEISGYETGASVPLIEGSVVEVQGSAHIPLGTGSWALKMKAGPALWLAHGALYGNELAPTLGTRGTFGLDTRPWPVVGFFVDVGASAWPGLADTLPSWSFTWDVRYGMVFWIRPHTRPS